MLTLTGTRSAFVGTSGLRRTARRALPVMSMDRPRTLLDKVWDEHVVTMRDEKTAILYVDRHLVHEVTSPQAFEGLWLA